jgi:sortase family protein
VLAAALGVACIAAGVALLPHSHAPHWGRVPAEAAPVAVAGPSRWHVAPTVPANTSGLTPARSQAGIPATVAGAPVAGNPVPLRLVRLRVPALQVDAPVLDVGVSAGQLQIPADPQVLGRWSGGAQPGEPYGSVVVAGHVDNQQEAGALFRLPTLHPGDTIVAVGADGRTRPYRVAAVREVAKAQLVTRLEPFRQNVAARLVLVSCGGTFDASRRTYADNIVVFAVPTGTGRA